MKAAAIEQRAESSYAGDFAELVKARLTSLVLLSTAAGYFMGSRGPLNWMAAFHAIFGTALCAAGAAALNQWSERHLDALMHRTMARPIPGGRMSAVHALVLGNLLAFGGVIYLIVFANLLAAVLAAATVAIYIFAYTPMKVRSTANTLVGAIPGALPPVIGWAAARGNVELGAWTLFAILFFWQMPHFFAIAWMFREDYSRAGFRMVSSEDETGARSASQSVLFTMFLLMVAGAPAFIQMTHPIYLLIELILTGAFLALAMRFVQTRTMTDARRLFLGSVLYLPLLLGALAATKR